MPHTRSLNPSKSSFLASTSRQISSVFCMSRLLVSEAGNQMIVHHSGRLHEGVAYCRTNKAKAPLDQSLAHAIRQFGFRWHLITVSPAIHQWFAIDERPQIGIQAAVLANHVKRGACIVAHGPDFQPIADDAG